MKNLTPLSLLAIVLSLLSCEPEQALPAVTTEAVKIILDLEEERYLFDGHWYPWGIPIVNCQPSYSLHLDWEEARLELRQCAGGGEMQAASIVLHHSVCEVAESLAIQIITERAFRTYQIQLPPEQLVCWQTDRQWLEVYFEIEL